MGKFLKSVHRILCFSAIVFSFPATATDGGDVASWFRMDFSGAELPGEMLNPMRWSIRNGVLCSPPPNASFLFGANDWVDYELSFKVRRSSVTDPDEQHWGLRIHYSNNPVMLYCRGRNLTFMISETRHTVLGTDFEAPMVTGSDAAWTFFQISVKRDRINVKVNGRELGTINNVPAGSGPIEFYNYNNTIELDDLQIALTGTAAPGAAHKENESGSGNLALNSSFEQCTNDELPDYWGVPHWGIIDPYWAVRYDAWTKHFRTVTDQAFHGKRSLRIENPVDGEASSGLHLTSCNFATQVGVPYRLSAYMKSEPAGLRVKMHDKIVTLSDQWQRYEADFTRADADLYKDMLRFIMQDRGVIYIDAVQLEEGSAATGYRLAAADRTMRVHEGGLKEIYDVPMHRTECRNDAVTLDGKLDEPFYQKMTPVRFVSVGNRPPKENTEAYFWYNQEGLFIAVNCDDADAANMEAIHRERDTHCWLDRSIEIFIDPTLSRGDYYHLVFNKIGTRYDAFMGDQSFDSSWQTATAVRPDGSGWSAEVFIPFGDLGITRSHPEQWGFNVCRNNQRLNEYTQWAPTYGLFHTPNRFGQLHIAREVQKEYFIDCGAIELKRSGAGKTTLHADVTNESSTPTRLDVKITLADMDQRQTQDFSRTVELAPGESKNVDFGDLTLAPQPRYRMKLAARNERDQMRLARNGTVEIEDFLSARLQYDYYTSEATARLRGSINLTDGELAAATICTVLATASGEISRNTFPVGGRSFEQELPIGKLPDGDYQLTVKLQIPGRGELAEQRITLKKLPPSPTEIKLDRFSRILAVNGKPFFAKGIFWDGELSVELIDYLGGIGINTLGLALPEEEAKARMLLDAAHRNNIICYVHSSAYFGEDVARAVIEKFKDHPAIIAWYSFDEPFTMPWGKDDPGKIFDTLANLEAVDPYRPVTVAENSYGMSFLKSKNLGFPGRLTTMDYYAWTPDGNFAETGVQCRKLYEFGVREGKACWAWLLGAGYAFHASRDYTPMEHEYSIYSAIINRMTGVMYLASHPKAPSSFARMKSLFGEIDALKEIIISTDEPPVVGNRNPSIELLVKKHQGNTYLISANNTAAPVDATFDLAALPGNGSAEVLFENRKVEIKDGILTDAFAGYQRHVYQIAK